MQKNTEQLALEYFDRLLNQKDLSVCDQLLSPEYIDHDADPQAEPGPQQTKAWVANFLQEHPQLQVEVQDIFATEKKVALRLVWHGTQTDHREGIVILHFDKYGRIKERWSAYL